MIAQISVTRANPISLLILAITAALLLGFWLRAIARISAAKAIVLSLVLNTAVIGWALASGPSIQQNLNSPIFPTRWQDPDNANIAAVLLAIFVAVNLAVALCIKVYRAAILHKATTAESSPGAVGMRAWLSQLNVISVIGLAIAGWAGLNYGIPATLLIGTSLLLVYPLVNTALNPAIAAPAIREAPAEERQRVLALVEAGKITADDAAELLSALAQSHVAENDSATAVSGPRRLMVLGGVLLLAGFLLPWFSLNESQAMRDAMGRVQQAISGVAASPLAVAPPPSIGNGTAVDVQTTVQLLLRGGDLRNGMGWIILACGLAAAALPFFWMPRAGNAQQQRNAALALLIAGSVALLYLVSDCFGPAVTIEPGLLLALAGYAALWAGAAKEYIVRSPRVRRMLVARAENSAA